MMTIWTHTSSQHFLSLYLGKLFYVTVVFHSRLIALGILTGKATIVKPRNTVRDNKIAKKRSQRKEEEEKMAKDKGMLSLWLLCMKWTDNLMWISILISLLFKFEASSCNSFHTYDYCFWKKFPYYSRDLVNMYTFLLLRCSWVCRNLNRPRISSLITVGVWLTCIHF